MSSTIQLDNDGPFDVYLASPPDGVPVKGGLVVIHEIWGLVDQIRGVADRFAAEGWVVAAPDILSRGGITPELGEELAAIRAGDDEEAKNAAQTRMREASTPRNSPEYGVWAVASLQKVLDHLDQQAGCTGHLAVTGFCFGGSYSFALAAADPRVKAAVPFYGSPPETSDLSKIQAPILAFYGDEDTRLIEGLPEVTAGMAAAGVDFTPTVYAGTGHAFFNERNPHAYNAEYAAQAWDAARAFLDEHAAAAGQA
ncbi:dienelactone hydrolase family protein [Frondihabitans australicus]|uniref:Carboxymethylenebutenolidase n=1 Tax=Frondihabitans australicus TaxID=386892 RepID=A0A495IEK0_9MICO|nr:dienelactone hydrolase family protein [Frondihabitans australicus]RKR74434.1 carboxymethylenebutenolidase [Frondihabitans australicus]